MNCFANRFHPATLKKKRIQRFILDVQSLYTIFLSTKEDSTAIKILEFKTIWMDSHMVYIHWCRIDDEDPEEYYQALYHTMIKKYYESQASRIFSLYCLYFTCLGSEQKIKISVDPAFASDLVTLLKDPKIASNKDICFVVKKLYGYFIFTVRTGIKTVLLRSNGQPLKKYNPDNPPDMEIDDYIKVETMLDYNELKAASHKYQKIKKQCRKVPWVAELNLTDKFSVQRIEERLERLTKMPL